MPPIGPPIGPPCKGIGDGEREIAKGDVARWWCKGGGTIRGGNAGLSDLIWNTAHVNPYDNEA